MAHPAWQNRGVTSPNGQVPEATPDQLPAAFPADGSALLDVREPNEWAAGHAPGAQHIPMAEVPQRLDELPDVDRLYVVCRSGGRSAQVAAYLNANGRDAINVAGGMGGWSASGRAMTGDDPNSEPYVL